MPPCGGHGRIPPPSSQARCRPQRPAASAAVAGGWCRTWASRPGGLNKDGSPRTAPQVSRTAPPFAALPMCCARLHPSTALALRTPPRPGPSTSVRSAFQPLCCRPPRSRATCPPPPSPVPVGGAAAGAERPPAAGALRRGGRRGPQKRRQFLSLFCPRRPHVRYSHQQPLHWPTDGAGAGAGCSTREEDLVAEETTAKGDTISAAGGGLAPAA